MSRLTEAGLRQIRSLGPGDEQALARFFQEVAQDPLTSRFFHPHPLTPKYAAEICRGAGRRRDAYFALWENKCIVGYSMLRGWDEGYEVPSFGVCVKPSHRGQGLGQLLLAHAIEESRSRGAAAMRLTVYRDNASAIHIYRKAGFRFRHKNLQELIGELDLVPVPRAFSPSASGACSVPD